MACVWCDPEAPIAVLQELHEDARYELNRSALLSGLNVALSPEALPACLNQALTSQEPPLEDRFYTEYLSSYFPKADVITKIIFPTMCTVAVNRALNSIIFVLTNVPWRYFVNNAEDLSFESVHVMIIEEQLGRIIAAVKKLSIDARTHLVCLPAAASEEGWNLGTAARKREMLVLQLWKKEQRMQYFFTMVALCIDTMIHRLYGFIRRENYSEAYSLHRKVEKMVEGLKGSRYEEQYVLTSRLFFDLLKMLEQRLWYQHDQDAAKRRDDDGDVASLVGVSVAGMSLAAPLEGNTSAHRFLDSFVGHYEANITGKFTHEYHPAVLEETAKSFATLEQELDGQGLPIVGRLTLMGYEEQGITRYKTKYTDAYFSDEMGRLTNAGWSLKMFNRFGLLTGFLCKDVARLAAKYPNALPVTHINPDQVEIFDGIGTLFQEHAFGEAYKPALQAYQRVRKTLMKGDFSAFFGEFMRFWHTLYSHELKVVGKQHVVGTQDILFSIAYMRYLRQSAVPVLHFYLGPDITYPIETSLLHHKEATRHAQTFVKTFVPQLKPLNNKKTAYVFCSFVDGVGKSTMLGNVQNMMKHGDAIDEYEHVDNSSSQLATVFDYSNDVVIADLPAQVSHFTYKPDGYVYVDCGALLNASALQEMVEYVHKNQVKLEVAFMAVLEEAGKMPEYDLVLAEQKNPELCYALNLHLLRKNSSYRWVSFTHENNYYLFDRDEPTSIRMRVPLATTPSHGLKNNCPEQMIFSIGVRFPMAYDYFLNDLIDQLKDHGAEQVVMVDFVSMYSRSSRENIRVNYVIQQLALLHKDFSLGASFYQDFVHNAQLLATLDGTDMMYKFSTALLQESLVRLALFDMLRDHAATNIDGIDLRTLTAQIRTRVAAYDASVEEYARSVVKNKMKQEYDRLFMAYGNTREYVTLQQFHATDLLVWSRSLVNIFSDHALCLSSNLWRQFQKASIVKAKTMLRDDHLGVTIARLDNGMEVEVLERIAPDCRDKAKLQSIVRMARARWYATCANLLYGRSTPEGIVIEEKFPVIPLIVLLDTEGSLCFVQPLLEKPTDEPDPKKVPDYSIFEVTYSPKKQVQWRTFEDQLYLYDWSEIKSSHGGVYAYGHELSNDPIEHQGMRSAIVSNLYTKFAQAHGADKVLVPVQLRAMMKDKMPALQANYDRWESKAKKNGAMPEKADVPSLLKPATGHEPDKMPVYLIADDQRPAVCLYLRMIATLDMLVKDLASDFALRRNSKEDFVEHIRLMECITLPWIFGLFSPDGLFDSYEEITPVAVVS